MWGCWHVLLVGGSVEPLKHNCAGKRLRHLSIGRRGSPIGQARRHECDLDLEQGHPVYEWAWRRVIAKEYAEMCTIRR